MKVEPEIRMWVQVFYSEGYPKELEGRGRENETRKAKKDNKGEITELVLNEGKWYSTPLGVI